MTKDNSDVDAYSDDREVMITMTMTTMVVSTIMMVVAREAVLMIGMSDDNVSDDDGDELDNAYDGGSDTSVCLLSNCL